MKKQLFMFMFLFFVIKINAQNNTIEGKVITSDGDPIEFATIVLQALDSTFINSAYTDSLGEFNLQYIDKQYRLIIQHLLYQTVDTTFSNNDIGVIILKEKDHILNEIIVKGERPVIKITDGKLTYDMPYLLEKKVAETAYDAIFQLPGVSNQSGSPTLIGSNNLNIIINGRPSTMTSDQLAELLKNTPSSRIEKAEVMYSAPPQYHIRGAVINLVMKKGTDSNLQGQVNTSFTQKYYSNYSLGTTLLYSNPKISTDFLYTLSQTKQKSGLNLFSDHLYDGTLYNIEQINRGYKKNLTHNLRLGVDYLIGQRALNVIYTSQITPKVNNYEASNGSISNSENSKKENKPIQMHNVGLTYTFKKEFTIGADYTYYEDKTIQDYKEKLTEKANDFIAQSNQNINRIKVNIDHSFELNTWGINYGAYGQYSVDHNLQKYNNLNESDTDNKQKEYTYDIYAGIDKQFSDKLSVSVSLTGEYYRLNDIKEWTIFPSAEMTYIYSSSNIFQLSLSSDRQYPNYWEMSNTVSYLNGYTEIWGNPILKPYRNYSGQLNYIHKSKYVITGYFIYDDNYFAQLPYQSSKKLKLTYQTTNFNYNQRLGLNISLPITFGLLSSRLTLNGFYHKVEDNSFHDISFDKENWGFYSKLDNTFNISNNPDLKAELSLAYISKNIQGPISISHLWNLECAIKWTSSDKKSMLSLKGYDLLNSWVPDMTSKYANQSLRMNLFPDSRFLTLSFSYKFGKDMKKLKEKSVDTSRFGKN